MEFNNIKRRRVDNDTNDYFRVEVSASTKIDTISQNINNLGHMVVNLTSKVEQFGEIYNIVSNINKTMEKLNRKIEDIKTKMGENKDELYNIKRELSDLQTHMLYSNYNNNNNDNNDNNDNNNNNNDNNDNNNNNDNNEMMTIDSNLNQNDMPSYFA